MTVFWDTVPYSPTEIDGRFIGAYYIALTMEAVTTPETSVNFYEITRRNIPEYRDLYIRGRENLNINILPLHFE
jgi:hypothetical protein